MTETRSQPQKLYLYLSVRWSYRKYIFRMAAILFLYITEFPQGWQRGGGGLTHIWDMGYWGVKNLGYGIWGLKNLEYGIWGNHLGYGIWGLKLLIFNAKFTYCDSYGAPLLLIYLQAISIPIMYCKCSFCYLFGPFDLYKAIMIIGC